MKLDRALTILEQFNEWRRDTTENVNPISPEKIGIAIDSILLHHKERDALMPQQAPKEVCENIVMSTGENCPRKPTKKVHDMDIMLCDKCYSNHLYWLKKNYKK